MLWVDKYRPQAFGEFTLNQNHATSLEKLLAKGSALGSVFRRHSDSLSIDAHCSASSGSAALDTLNAMQGISRI